MVPMLNTKTVSNAWRNMFDALHKSCVEWMYKEWLYFLLSWCLILVSISLCIAPWPCGRMRKLKYPPPPTFSLVCVCLCGLLMTIHKDNSVQYFSTYCIKSKYWKKMKIRIICGVYLVQASTLSLQHWPMPNYVLFSLKGK